MDLDVAGGPARPHGRILGMLVCRRQPYCRWMKTRLPGQLAVAALIMSSLVVGSTASAGTPIRSPGVPHDGARAATTPPPCIDWSSIYDRSTSRFHEVQVPGPGGPFQGYLVVPVNHPAMFVGGAVLLHGAGGDACSLWWAARLLAQHGFVALTLHYEAPAEAGGYEAAGEDAGRAGLAYLATLSNITPHRLALIGHSLGSSAAMGIQSKLSNVVATARKTVSTVVALDNLRAYTKQDPGGGTHCSDSPSGKVKPRVPAIGIVPWWCVRTIRPGVPSARASTSARREKAAAGDGSRARQQHPQFLHRCPPGHGRHAPAAPDPDEAHGLLHGGLGAPLAAERQESGRSAALATSARGGNHQDPAQRQHLQDQRPHGGAPQQDSARRSGAGQVLGVPAITHLPGPAALPAPVSVRIPGQRGPVT